MLELQTSIVSGSPFEDFIRKHLPPFNFDVFNEEDTARIREIYKHLCIVLDSIYQKVIKYEVQLDKRSANLKFLYQIGKNIGMDEFEDLSLYIDEYGNVKDVPLGTFKSFALQQKSQIINAVPNYLLKGTRESIDRAIYSSLKITELWTNNLASFFEVTNPLVTKYGNPIEGTPLNIFYAEEDYDINTEMMTQMPSASVGNILDFQSNNFGYIYLLDSNNNLFYKTAEDSDVPNTWFPFTSNLNALSAGIQDFKLKSNKIYLHTTNNNLVVFNYRLDKNLFPILNIHTSDCYFFDFAGDFVLLDKGTKLELRLGKSLQFLDIQDKPVTDSSLIMSVVRKSDIEYYLINANGKAYNVQIQSSENLIVSSTLFDLDFNASITKFYSWFEEGKLKFIKLDTFSLDYVDLETGVLYTLSLPESFSDPVKILNYDGILLLVGKNKIGIFNPSNEEEFTYDYVTPGDYTNLFLLDKFYLYSVGNPLKRILGWNHTHPKKVLRFDGVNSWDTSKPPLPFHLDGREGLPFIRFGDNDDSGTEKIYKTHYFDVKVDLALLPLIAIINDMQLDETTFDEVIKRKIEKVKPAHTSKIRQITYVGSITDSPFFGEGFFGEGFFGM